MLASNPASILNHKHPDLGILRFSQSRKRSKGNLGHQITLRDLGDGVTEICALSLWTDMEAVKAYAGEQPERAHYYPQDDHYLINKPEFVEHHVVVYGDLASL